MEQQLKMQPTKEIDADAVEFIRSHRGIDMTQDQIAQDLNELGYRTAGGGRIISTTISEIARKYGMGSLRKITKTKKPSERTLSESFKLVNETVKAYQSMSRVEQNAFLDQVELCRK